MVGLLSTGTPVELDAPRIITLAQRCMPIAEHVALVRQAGETVRTVAASSEMAAELDRICAEVGEGPALDVLQVNEMVYSDDLLADPRWPQFGTRAHDELGARSLVSYRLRLGARRRMAVVLVSDWPFGFDDFAIATGSIFAAYCSLALLVRHNQRDTVAS